MLKTTLGRLLPKYSYPFSQVQTANSVFQPNTINAGSGSKTET